MTLFSHRRAELLSRCEAGKEAISEQQTEEWHIIERLLHSFVEHQRRMESQSQITQIALKAKVERQTFAIPHLASELSASEKEKRTNRIVLEEKVRLSILTLFQREFSVLCSKEKIVKLFKAEAAKRYSIERAEEKETADFRQLFRKTPWKPTLWVLGTCPFHKKGCCPFANGLCHGLNVPPLHFAASQTVIEEEEIEKNPEEEQWTFVDVGPPTREMNALTTDILDLAVARVH
jgi:hypothetical protein